MIKNAVQLFVSKEAAESCLHGVFILTKYKWLYARISGILVGSNIVSLASLMYVYSCCRGSWIRMARTACWLTYCKIRTLSVLNTHLTYYYAFFSHTP